MLHIKIHLLKEKQVVFFSWQIDFLTQNTQSSFPKSHNFDLESFDNLNSLLTIN